MARILKFHNSKFVFYYKNTTMNILTNTIPQWVSILFIVTFCVTIVVIANMVKKGACCANLNPKIYYNSIISFLLAFYLYKSLMSFTGIFQQNTLPPKIFLFTSMPLLVFYFLITGINKNWKNIVSNISLPTLIRFHIIRFVGVFFFIIYYYNALPKYFAISAGIGDVLAAFTAIFVAKLAERKAKYYKPITIAWNIIGLIDILNVVVSGMIITKLSITTGSQSLTTQI